jgi:hypothetical protein
MAGAKPPRTPGRRLDEQRRQPGIPNPARFVGEHGAPDQEHFSQVTQAQLVARPPEEEHDVARAPVQRRASPLVVPPPALPAAEAMNRSPRPLGGRGGMAMRAVQGGSLDLSKRARDPIRQCLSRQAAPEI